MTIFLPLALLTIANLFCHLLPAVNVCDCKSILAHFGFDTDDSITRMIITCDPNFCALSWHFTLLRWALLKSRNITTVSLHFIHEFNIIVIRWHIVKRYPWDLDMSQPDVFPLLRWWGYLPLAILISMHRLHFKAAFCHFQVTLAIFLFLDSHENSKSM